ncbi:MAG TPA: tetratricopeptide repeat protein [Polyangia bacterium]|nr:tetratricopeptide repeat protein [Polyangia bacterium]
MLALALALPASAASAAPPQPPQATSGNANIVEKLFDEWRFRDGTVALQELVRSAPQAPQTLVMEGYAAFLKGDYDASVKKLAAAIDEAGAESTAAAAAKELQGLAGEARDAIKDHLEERSAHFLMRYPAEDAVLVPYALEALESAYAALHDDLGFEAEMPIRIEIYRNPSDLAAVSSLSPAEVARTGTIALCKWARLMVTTPRALAYGYPWLDSMNHELVHYAVSALTGDRAPVWLQEGLAKFLERRWREPAGGRLAPSMEHLLARALRGGKLISFDAMHPSMAKLPSAEDATLAFAEVANAVAYLHSLGGMPALRTAIKKVNAGADARGAVADTAGGSWSEFERGWRAFMNGQHYKMAAAIDIPTTHIRKAGAIASRRKPTEDEALSSSQKQTAAFRYLRLGNMMLQNNRLRAAAIEYEKGARSGGVAGTGGGAGGRGSARGNDPAVHWIFPVKLGRIYLALGEPDRALKALAGAIALYPDLPWPHLISGQALLAKGDPAAAVVALRTSLATNPFDPAVHCSLADAYGKVPAAGPPGSREREQRFCRELAE